MPNKPLPEFSRTINLPNCYDQGENLYFEASEQERKNLISRLGINNLHLFSTRFELKFLKRHPIDFDVRGSFMAHFSDHQGLKREVKDDFSFLVIHPTLKNAVEQAWNEFEDIEFSEDGTIDLGEIATQYLILCLDDQDDNHDRHEKNSTFAVNEEKKTSTPFDVLSQLKDLKKQ